MPLQGPWEGVLGQVVGLHPEVTSLVLTTGRISLGERTNDSPETWQAVAEPWGAMGQRQGAKGQRGNGDHSESWGAVFLDPVVGYPLSRQIQKGGTILSAAEELQWDMGQTHPCRGEARRASSMRHESSLPWS